MERGRTLKIFVLSLWTRFLAVSFCSTTCISIVLCLEQNHRDCLWDQGETMSAVSPGGAGFGISPSEEGLGELHPHVQSQHSCQVSYLPCPCPDSAVWVRKVSCCPGCSISSLRGVGLRPLPLQHVWRTPWVAVVKLNALSAASSLCYCWR